MRLLQNTLRNHLFVIPQCLHHRCTCTHILMRWIFNHLLCMHEQLHLLIAFLLQRSEILIVLMADICDHTNSRTDDALQLLHLPGLAYSRLEDGNGLLRPCNL